VPLSSFGYANIQGYKVSSFLQIVCFIVICDDSDSMNFIYGTRVLKCFSRYTDESSLESSANIDIDILLASEVFGKEVVNY